MKKHFLSNNRIGLILAVSLIFFSFEAVMLFIPGLDYVEAIGPFVNNNLPTKAPNTSIQLQEIHTEIEWESPQAALPLPGTNALLVVEMDGRFYTVPDTDNATETEKKLVLDIQDRCWYYGWADIVNNKHGGFQNAIFHPEFGQGSGNDYIYVYYLYHPASDDSITGNNAQYYYDRLSRFSWTGTDFDPNSELIMIQQFDTAAGHDGGGLLFDNDGFLYISVGDEGSQGGEATAHTQTLDDRFRSGVWRIDVDMIGGSTSHPIERQPNNSNVVSGAEPSFTQGYYIPNDNPWVTGTGEFLEEFYALGLRQPFRMTYDPPTGNIWLGDVGGGKVEEIDLIDKPGLNFQWNYKEGFQDGFRNKPTPFYGEERVPLHEYGRGEGRAVIGGYVYRGDAIPSLTGKYIYGDNATGAVWAMTHNGGNTAGTIEELGNVGGSVFNGISGFGLNHDNEIIILKLSAGGTNGAGKLFKIVETNEASAEEQLPALLSETGIFSDMFNLVPSDGFIPYETINPLWSSGTDKSRWVAIPQDGNVDSTTEQIGYSENEAWSFPVGTTFVKHFNNTNGTKLETRVWLHGEDGNWFGSTYKWRPNGQEADLLLSGDMETINIDGDSFEYEYPSATSCVQCHNQAAGHVLGFNTRQLNKTIEYPSTGRTANQLETLASLGFIPPVDTNNVLTLVPIEDNNVPLESRVRSYFDSNCAYCHLPGNTRAGFDMRYTTDFEQQNLVNGAIIEDLGIMGAVTIAPGDMEKSMIYHRMNSVDIEEMMPPLAKGRIDTEAVQLLEAWISSLNGSCDTADNTIMGNADVVDGNFIDAHSPHININRTGAFTNATEENLHICLQEFTFYAQRVGNPVTPFVVKVIGENDFIVSAIGETRTAAQYSIGINVFNFSDHTNDAIVLKPGESIAPGFMDSYPDGSGSIPGNSLIPAITNGQTDDVWQAYKLNEGVNPQLKMGAMPQGNPIAENLARSYQFNVGININTIVDSNPPAVPDDENLALNKATVQSSTDFGGVSSRAVDGNLSGVYKNNSITHTEFSTNPWWRVDLGKTYPITTIKIFNRGTTDNCEGASGSCPNRLAGAKVYIGNTESDDPTDYTEVGTLDAGVEQEIGNLSLSGRYVMVHLAGENKTLSLAEVEVYGGEASTPIAVTGISVSPVETLVAVGQTVQLNATVSPVDADDQTVTWSSSDADLATVDENGLITGLAVGSAVLTATTTDGGYEATVSVTVEEQTIAGNDNLALNKATVQSSTDFGGVSSRAVDGNLSGVYKNNSITHTEFSTNPWWRVDLGKTYPITTIKIFNRGTTDNCEGASGSCPNRLAGAKVYIGNTESDDPTDYTEVGTLDAGVEQEIGNLSLSGRYVMVHLAGENKTLSLAEVEVYGGEASTPIAVTGISVSPVETLVAVGQTVQLNATVSPVDADDQTVTWSSSDADLATVDENGLITGLAVGSAVLTATTTDGGYEATVSVTVEEQTIAGNDNLALNKATVQSSTDFGGVSSRAVDGNLSGVYKNNSITHTEFSTNPWWRVDLGKTYPITTIKIFNRGTTDNCEGASGSCPNRLAGAKVYIGNTESDDPADYTEVGILDAGVEQEIGNLTFSGRYVMVHLAGENKTLSLAEVEVYGDTPSQDLPTGVATIYQDALFEGISMALPIGDYQNLNQEDMGSNTVTSVQVSAGFTVELYPDLNFKGTPLSLTSDTKDLVVFSFDNNTESIKVFATIIADEDEKCKCASGQISLLVNGSFEETTHQSYDTAYDLIEDLGKMNSGVKFVDAHVDTDFPGWFATGGLPLQQGGFSQGGTFELGQTGFLGVSAPDGRVFAEMDGNIHNQLIAVEPGQLLDWELSHRGRPGVDEITISAGPTDNQTIVAVVSSPNTEWIRHTGQYEVPIGVDTIQFSIAPTGAANGDTDSSNLLDFVKLCPSNSNQIAVPAVISVNELESLKLYPNPVNDILYFAFEEPTTTTFMVEIYSITGAILQKDKIEFNNDTNMSIDVELLNPGMYNILITNELNQQTNFGILKN